MIAWAIRPAILSGARPAGRAVARRRWVAPTVNSQLQSPDTVVARSHVEVCYRPVQPRRRSARADVAGAADVVAPVTGCVLVVIVVVVEVVRAIEGH